jgi:spore coat protein U-like protein
MNRIGTKALPRGGIAALALAVGMGAQAQTTLNVSATLQEGCEVVSASAALSFGTFTPLDSTGDRLANTGSSFQVRCTSNASPSLYATGTRKLTKGGDEIGFLLSANPVAVADDLPSTLATALPLTSLAKDGTAETVTLYGRVRVDNYSNKPGGAYSSAITLQLVY